MNKEQWIKLLKLGLPIMLGTFLIIGVSYAWLTLTLNGTRTNTLTAGTLLLELDDTMGDGITLNEAIPMYDEVGLTTKAYTFTLENVGTVDSEYTIYLDDVTLASNETRLADQFVKYNLVRDEASLTTALVSSMGVNPNRVLDTGVISPGDKYTYELRLWLDESVTSSQMGQVFKGKIRVVASQVIPVVQNILAVYQYDQTNQDTFCVTGEESTCVQLTHSQDATYEKGTIIRYQVNASESYYFHVLYDNGDTLTLQQRENTLLSDWYTSYNNIYGPTTAISALEMETSDWSNVLDQTYTMGSTIFGNAANAYTGCTDYPSFTTYSCTSNTYTWEVKTSKARMITLQEVLSTGCTSSDKSCPVWMYNYMRRSTDYGGTNASGNSVKEEEYYTMSANSISSDGNVDNSAIIISQSGCISITYPAYERGVRAVIVIKK